MNAEGLDFLNNMEEAYKDGYGCEIDVHVDDQEFKASKWMLRAKSSVFRAMFSGETKENQTNSVTINGFDVDVVEQFLCYLHTGEVSDSYAERIKFFPIADYYNVKELREICLNAMYLSLDPTNAQEYFKMAEKFSLDELKARALIVMTADLNGENFYNYLEFARSNKSEKLEANVIKFIEANMWKLCKSPDWKKLDPEIRLRSFENRLENLDFDLERILKRKLMLEIDHRGAATWNGVCFSKEIVLKNTGSMRLVYRISPASPGQYFSADSRSKFIEPGQAQHVTIQYYTDSQTTIDYQATTERSIDQCFQNNSFRRQIVRKMG